MNEPWKDFGSGDTAVETPPWEDFQPVRENSTPPWEDFTPENSTRQQELLTDQMPDVAGLPSDVVQAGREARLAKLGMPSGTVVEPLPKLAARKLIAEPLHLNPETYADGMAALQASELMHNQVESGLKTHEEARRIFEESMQAQSIPPTQGEKSAAAIVNLVNENTAAMATDPLVLGATVTGMRPVQAAMGAAAPLVNRALSLGFGGQMVAGTPDVAKEVGTAFGGTDQTEKVRAVGQAALHAAMTPAALFHGARPFTPQERAITTTEKTPFDAAVERAKAVLPQAAAALEGKEATVEVKPAPVPEPTPEPKVTMAGKILAARGVEPDVAAAVEDYVGQKNPNETAEAYRARLFKAHDEFGFRVKKEAMNRFNTNPEMMRQAMLKEGWTPDQIEEGLKRAQAENQVVLDNIDKVNSELLAKGVPKRATFNMPAPGESSAKGVPDAGKIESSDALHVGEAPGNSQAVGEGVPPPVQGPAGVRAKEAEVTPLSSSKIVLLKQQGLSDVDISDLQSGKVSVSDIINRKLQPFEGGGGPDHAAALEKARIEAAGKIFQILEKPEVTPAIAPVVQKSAIVQVPEPKAFNTIQDILDFRNTRLSEERALWKEQIGLSEDQALQLQEMLARELSTKSFEKKLTPGQRLKLEAFFEGPYNQKKGPFKIWETDKRINPEDVAKSEDLGELTATLIDAVEHGVEQNTHSDMFVGAVIAGRRLAELGYTKSNIAIYLDQYTTQKSGSQGDKAFYFKKLGTDINNFLGSQGIVLHEGEFGAPSRKPVPPSAEPAKPISPAAEPQPAPGSEVKKQGAEAAEVPIEPTLTKEVIPHAEEKGKGKVPLTDTGAAGTPAAPSANPEEPKASGTVERTLGFGGTETRTTSPGQPTPPKPQVATTPQELDAVVKAHTPGLGIGRDILQGIKSLLLPSAKSPAHLKAAELLGAKIGAMNQRSESAASQLKPHSRAFDKLGVDREGVEPAKNPGIQFMSAMSQGKKMGGWFKTAADTIQRLFDLRIAALEKAGAALQTIRENYFPGMWTRDSRLAFNAAMERAEKEGIIGKDFNVNDATPEQRATIKAMVDKFLEEGTTSDKDALGYLTRKPLAGKESFRKQKVFDDIMDAAEFGLRPISNNPIELAKLKMTEMDKSIMAHEYFQALKARGEMNIISPYEEVPQGWVKVNDKYGTIYGKPTVEEREFVDKSIYGGLMAVAKGLGITPERVFRAGRGKLGYASTSGKTVSQFATELSVLAHELGHQLDFKYGLWDLIAKGEPPGSRSQTGKELRALADLSWEGSEASQYFKQQVRKKAEKMAHLLEAYIHAPEKFKQVAPTVFADFDNFIRSRPELKGLAEIKPGIALQKLTNERYVGLPIMGYRIVPEAHGDLINNYLSSSLYNNRYFGTLYKGWMAMANSLNQTQLGMGSAFHAGFTTAEAQISSNANVLKDIYGIIRGNRSAADLGNTALKSLIASVHTSVVGDRVLNAWRDPQGAIDPRIAQVVRAAELAGGGFKMETGLRTEQTTKLVRDWYSGHAIRAAARSPIALTELMAKPIMEFLVPRQKAGVFADLAWRIIEQNPGKTLESMTPQFRQAWNRIDARLGQVRYNRLFTKNAAKNAVQGLVRAPGWSGGTIAEIGGGFADAGSFVAEWGKTGKMPENLPDRTAYVMSLLATVTAINGALTFAFTGTAPKGLDFWAFRTGKKDEQGRDERFMLPTYVKDIIAYAKHTGETLRNKSHPLLAMINDLFFKNKDYYGTEIRSPDSSIPNQALESLEYVVKSYEPFWTRGVRREHQRDVGLVREVAPFFGVMPAPRAVTQTPAEGLAHDFLMQQIPGGARTKAQAEKALEKAKQNPGGDYLVRTVKKLNALSAVRVLEKATPEERGRILREVKLKIVNSKSLTAEERKALWKRTAEK